MVRICSSLWETQDKQGYAPWSFYDPLLWSLDPSKSYQLSFITTLWNWWRQLVDYSQYVLLLSLLLMFQGYVKVLIVQVEKQEVFVCWEGSCSGNKGDVGAIMGNGLLTENLLAVLDTAVLTRFLSLMIWVQDQPLPVV